MEDTTSETLGIIVGVVLYFFIPLGLDYIWEKVRDNEWRR